MKMSFKFEGTVGELIRVLAGLDPQDTVVFRSHAAKVEKVETLEDKAWRLAKPFAVAGQKIKAIRAWREVTNHGLKEAKDAVESRGTSEGIYHYSVDGYLVNKETV